MEEYTKKAGDVVEDQPEEAEEDKFGKKKGKKLVQPKYEMPPSDSDEEVPKPESKPAK